MGGNGEIVSQCVDYYNYCSIKRLRMPASVDLWGALAIRTKPALRLIVQDQSGKKETFRKEENADDMYNAKFSQSNCRRLREEDACSRRPNLR